MTALIDTHVLLWWIGAGDEQVLPAEVLALLSDSNTNVVVSAAVIWEIAIKRSLGKLNAPSNITHLLEHAGMSTLSMSVRHAEAAGALPYIHRDPFDRMLVAQAMAEGLPIITADNEIAKYGVETLWLNP